MLQQQTTCEILKVTKIPINLKICLFENLKIGLPDFEWARKIATID
jgi:hypothetical protein